MSFDTYKIVDATELDNDLASIATALRNKNSSLGTLAFPEGYVSAINGLQYDANPNTDSDISFSGDNVLVNEGYFSSQTTKAMPTDYVGTGIARQAAKTVTPSASAQTAVATNTYTTGAVTVAAIPSSYVDVSSITKTSTDFDGTVITGTEATFTIPAGYYPDDIEVSVLMA